MGVQIDKTGQQDLPGGVDDICIVRNRKLRTDGGDLTVVG
jgi:hypothetical protein